MTRSTPDGRVKRIALAWAANTAAIFAADLLVDGIRITGWWRVLVAGAVFGLVNWLVRPVVRALALPVIILSLGIALFFINLLMLYITDWVMPDFHIDSFGAAITATFVIWLVNVVLHLIFGVGRSRAHRGNRRSLRP